MTNKHLDIPNKQNNTDGIIELPAILTAHTIIYPEMVHTLTINTTEDRLAIEAALTQSTTALLLTQLPDNPKKANTHGMEITINTIPNFDESNRVLIRGKQRVEILGFTQNKPYIICQAKILHTTTENQPNTHAVMRAAITLLKQIPDISGENLTIARSIDNPGQLADFIAAILSPPLPENLQILQTLDDTDRLRQVMTFLTQKIVMIEIENETQNELEREERENYLREQIRIIQSKLGETDIFQQEIDELQQRIDDAELPPEVYTRAMKEISRLVMVSPMAPEIGLIHNYIDWIVSLPWQKQHNDNLDIAHAAKVLDEDHYGLSRVKDRVLEYIAVRKLAAEKMQTPVLCFVGPPGTGKTSLGKSIARALGREFARVSLGGISDEAEIRGHRRTYVGAMPGRIIQTMRRLGTKNPVLMLDEIDKLEADFHGDPGAALLEVLDPEQNKDFLDHYLDIPYDLSQVLFITTANDLYPLSAALEDRLEIIEFPGYIEEDKLTIAQDFLIPRQLEAHGLANLNIKFETATLQTIIREYTYEAGVRNLNRRIAEVLRKIARLSAEGKRYPQRIKPKRLEKTLGPPDHTIMRANDEDQIGVVTGLSWTAGGGEIDTVEVALLPGKGTLTLTGQLGEVLQESAQIALSYMRQRAEDFDVDDDDFENYDLHIHLPEGAIFKEGPSAGVTLAIAIISVFTECKVRSDYAMTGEITLRGKVLPVGGVREKVMAARRARIPNIILPEINKRDLVELPKQALRDINFLFVNDMQEVMDAVLLPPPPERKRDRDTEDEIEDDENE